MFALHSFGAWVSAVHFGAQWGRKALPTFKENQIQVEIHGDGEVPAPPHPHPGTQ